jgi:hypothetical protein
MSLKFRGDFLRGWAQAFCRRCYGMGVSHSERFIYDDHIVESKQFGASLVRILIYLVHTRALARRLVELTTSLVLACL